MTKERLGKILFRWTLLLMFLHVLALLVSYGLSVPSYVISYEPSDHSYIKQIALSRWYDLFVWPLFACLYYFIIWPLFEWFDMKRIKEHEVANIPDIFRFFLWISLVVFTCSSIIIGVLATVAKGLLAGLLLGLSCGALVGILMSIMIFVFIVLFATLMGLVDTFKHSIFRSKAWKYMTGEDEKKEGEN